MGLNQVDDNYVFVALDYAVTERESKPCGGDLVWAIAITNAVTHNTRRIFVKRQIDKFAEAWRRPSEEDGRFVEARGNKVCLTSDNPHFRKIHMDRNTHNAAGDFWKEL